MKENKWFETQKANIKQIIKREYAELSTLCLDSGNNHETELERYDRSISAFEDTLELLTDIQLVAECSATYSAFKTALFDFGLWEDFILTFNRLEFRYEVFGLTELQAKRLKNLCKESIESEFQRYGIHGLMLLSKKLGISCL